MSVHHSPFHDEPEIRCTVIIPGKSSVGSSFWCEKSGVGSSFWQNGEEIRCQFSILGRDGNPVSSSSFWETDRSPVWITDIGLDELSLKKRHRFYVTFMTDLSDPTRPQILAEEIRCQFTILARRKSGVSSAFCGRNRGQFIIRRRAS